MTLNNFVQRIREEERIGGTNIRFHVKLTPQGQAKQQQGIPLEQLAHEIDYTTLVHCPDIVTAKRGADLRIVQYSQTRIITDVYVF